MSFEERNIAMSANAAAGSSGNTASFDVVVIGGGAAGIGVTASLLRRRPDLSIAIVEPGDRHFYQPAWTLVGGGAFNINDTARPMSSVMPEKARWLRAGASAIEPDQKRIRLDDGEVIGYQQLIVCPGLRLAWEKIEGLEEALGKNGVTSNYRFDLAPYTWKLVNEMKHGKAVFTQPAMPIKCAGAPQKALYLSCDHWLRQGVLEHIDVEFNLAGDVLFGVAAFVPSLMKYVERYRASLAFGSNLVSVDGARKIATFSIKDEAGDVVRIDKPFDMLHVVPPQVPLDVVRNSALSDKAGWCEVDHATLAHPRYPGVFALGDACSAPNAKTAAAVRKQIIVVAENLLAARDAKPLPARYDGYGACPLTVEKGKVVLAEFGYGGKLLATFPLDPTVPRALAWHLKTAVLPWLYWNGMLKGREWLARPAKSNA
jgi:sulfide:quinone oxidoreductase